MGQSPGLKNREDIKYRNSIIKGRLHIAHLPFLNLPE